jgi:hypothetical protein
LEWVLTNVSPKNKFKTLWSLKTSVFFISFLLTPSCTSIPFDFEAPDDECSDLETVSVTEISTLKDDKDFEYLTSENSAIITVNTRHPDSAVGCASSDEAVGIIDFGELPFETDLYLWTMDDKKFDKTARPAFYLDKCGNTLLASSVSCNKNPWITARQIPSGKHAYVHIITDKPRTVTVGYDLRPVNSWHPAISDFKKPISCSLIHNDNLWLNFLPHLNPPDGEININAAMLGPPVKGQPEICGKNSAGYRQMGFLVRNSSDYDIMISKIILIERDLPETEPIIYNLTVYMCNDLNSLTLDAKEDDKSMALWKRCTDTMSKTDIVLKKLSPEDEIFDYVFVFQVPPWISSNLKLVIESSPLF